MNERRIDSIGLQGNSQQRKQQYRQLQRTHGKDRVTKHNIRPTLVFVYIGDWTPEELLRRRRN
jgi:hypothetical protein